MAGIWAGSRGDFYGLFLLLGKRALLKWESAFPIPASAWPSGWWRRINMSNDFKLHFFISGILKEHQETHTLERDWLGMWWGGLLPSVLCPYVFTFCNSVPCSIHHPSLPAFSSLSKARGEIYLLEMKINSADFAPLWCVIALHRVNCTPKASDSWRKAPKRSRAFTNKHTLSHASLVYGYYNLRSTFTFLR